MPGLLAGRHCALGTPGDCAERMVEFAKAGARCHPEGEGGDGLAMGWLRGAFGRRERRSVELRPDEQIALAELLRAGETRGSDMVKAVEAMRGAGWEPPDQAVRDLQAKGLIALVRVRGADAYYRPTKQGERLRDRLPPDPRSVIEFRL